jgi:rhodanese-related sulfurtransferase
MDAHDTSPSISVDELGRRLTAEGAPIVVDVRRAPAFDAGNRIVAGALRGYPAATGDWATSLPRDADIVVYCVHGHEVSQGVAAALEAQGLPVRYLAGGFEAWSTAGLPVRERVRYLRRPGDPPTRWITRERPKIDRIACPWAIRRFVDPEAEFLYAPADRVRAEAAARQAIPYDIPDVEFSHVGPRCSFDAVIERFGISDPALDILAAIVRGADTGHPELAPEAAGLLAVSLGLSALHADDLVMLRHGLRIYDALYAWAARARGEVHGWPPKG